jgi:hypothetical protein
MKRLIHQFQYRTIVNKQIFNKNKMEIGLKSDESYQINESINYQDLCIYCFDVLVNHLTNSNELATFPDSFKSVYFI